jgi:hypothetical protein
MEVIKAKMSIQAFKNKAIELHDHLTAGLNKGIELGRHLNAFIEAKGYLPVYDTIEEFLEKTLPWKKTYIYDIRAVARFADAQQLMGALGQAAKIPKSVTQGKKMMQVETKALKERLENSAPCEPVIDVPSEVKSYLSTPVTAKSVMAAAKALVSGAQKPTPVEDDMGCIIPEPLLPIWNRRQEIQDLMTAVSLVKCTIEQGREDEDMLLMKIPQGALDKLESAYSYLKDAKPFCVCGICEGRLETKPDRFCKSCDSTGIMSENQYNRLVPEEARKIRKLAIAQRKKK